MQKIIMYIRNFFKKKIPVQDNDYINHKTDYHQIIKINTCKVKKINFYNNND